MIDNVPSNVPVFEKGAGFYLPDDIIDKEEEVTFIHSLVNRKNVYIDYGET